MEKLFLLNSSFLFSYVNMKKDCYILSFKPAGVAPSPDIHDTSAAISKNGKIIAAVEEERLVRIKHAVGMFPVRSISYCLDEAGIGFQILIVSLYLMILIYTGETFLALGIGIVYCIDYK